MTLLDCTRDLLCPTVLATESVSADSELELGEGATS
jgi:hypothetical protein